MNFNVIRFGMAAFWVCSVGFELRSAEPPVNPATAEQAAAVLNLADFPLVEGANESPNRDIAAQSYTARSTVKAAFGSLQESFAERKWMVMGDPYVSEDTCSLTLQKQGYVVTLVVFKQDPESVSITIQNLGNVDLSKLPVPKAVKPFYKTTANVAYLSDESTAQIRAEARKLLLADGWESYGETDETFDVKKNAVALSVRVSQAPAQDNKTVITYATQLMSMDLPAPPDAKDVHYSDSNRGLYVETSLSQDEVIQFYRERLAKNGWKPTTEKTFKLEIYEAMIFRNKLQEMLTLKLIDFEGKTRATIEYRSPEQLARIEKQLKEDRARLQARKDSPKSTVVVKPPKNASVEKNTKQEIEFHVKRGAKMYVDTLAAEFKKDGWTVGKTVAEELAGEYTFSKNEMELHVSYLDTGILPGEITISVFRGAELELQDKK